MKEDEKGHNSTDFNDGGIVKILIKLCDPKTNQNRT